MSGNEMKHTNLKRLVCFLLLTLMVAGAFVSMVSSVPSTPSTIYLDDDFEGDAGGSSPSSVWFTYSETDYTNRANVTASTAHTGSKSYNIMGDQTALPYVNFDWDVNYHVTHMSFYFKTAGNCPIGEQQGTRLLLAQGVVTGVFDAHFVGNHIYFDGVDMGAYSTNVWYRIRTTMNFTTSKYRLQVNNTDKGWHSFCCGGCTAATRLHIGGWWADGIQYDSRFFIDDIELDAHYPLLSNFGPANGTLHAQSSTVWCHPYNPQNHSMRATIYMFEYISGLSKWDLVGSTVHNTIHNGFNATYTPPAGVAGVPGYLWMVDVLDLSLMEGDTIPTSSPGAVHVSGYPGDISSYGAYAYWFNDMPVDPVVTLTPHTTVTSLVWKTTHMLHVAVNYTVPYDVEIGISNPWHPNYIYMTGNDPSSPYYNISMNGLTGLNNFTIDGSRWVPFYGAYTVWTKVYSAYYSPYFSANRMFNVSGTAGKATEVSLTGFSPVPDDENQYTLVGKSVTYQMMTNTTNPADTVTPHAHLFLTEADGTVIRQYHSDFTLWSTIPVMALMGQYSAFWTSTQWASQLQMNHDYNFYIGFSRTKWTASNLDLQLPYTGGTILSFEGNDYDWLHPSITRIYDDLASGGGTEYYGVKISFGTYTGTGVGGGGGTNPGDVTGGTWGPTLGTQIDAATGVSGSAMIVGIFVIALFALLPVIITHTVPPLPILLMFTGMGMVMSFGMGFFPLWVFFLVVVIAALIFVYKVKSWITQAWGGDAGAMNPLQGITKQETGTFKKVFKKLGGEK